MDKWIDKGCGQRVTDYDLRDAADRAVDALGAALGVLDPDTGNNGVVVRPDLNMIIVYAQTATHMLEARTTGRGQYRYRINRDVFERAADIPATYRKLGAIARAAETADALVLNALHTRYRADLALTAVNEYRPEDVRARAIDALNDESGFEIC